MQLAICEKITIFIYFDNNPLAMLIRFKVSNFLSFKEEVTFSMIANKDDTLINNLFNSKDFLLKKSAVIFGPNGTGKTNLIKALALTKYLVLHSKNFKKEEEFMERPFKLDSNYGIIKPITFEIDFLKENNVYNYLIKISLEKKGEYNFFIAQEKLTKNDRLLFDFYETDRNKSRYDASLKDEIEKRVSLKNKNILLLSHVREKNFDQFDEVFGWFKDNLEVFVRGFESKVNVEKELENKELNDAVLKTLNNCSFSRISKMEVVKKKFDVEKFLEHVREEQVLTEKALDLIKKEKTDYSWEINSYHKNNLNKEVGFSMRDEESSGTNTFVNLLVHILKAEKNKVLIIDEIEKNLHPILLKKIYELIHLSKNNIQLIATTHAYPLLLFVNDEQNEIFRRDQIYFTRLLKNESTEVYSLINVGGIRKDLKIFKAYFDGRLEAFPVCKNEPE